MLELLEQIIQSHKDGIHRALYDVRRCQPSVGPHTKWTNSPGPEIIELRDNDQVLSKGNTLGILSVQGTVVTVDNWLRDQERPDGSVSYYTTRLDLAHPDSLPQLLWALEQIGIDYINDRIQVGQQANRPHYVIMWQEILMDYINTPTESNNHGPTHSNW